jgi:excisionase family DNA binding protein
VQNLGYGIYLPVAVHLFSAMLECMKLLSTSETAVRLGVSERRVRSMIKEGKLSAHRLGRDYAIEEKALVGVIVYGKPGRPPKQVTDGTVKARKETPTKLRTRKRQG